MGQQLDFFCMLCEVIVEWNAINKRRFSLVGLHVHRAAADDVEQEHCPLCRLLRAALHRVKHTTHLLNHDKRSISTVQSHKPLQLLNVVIYFEKKIHNAYSFLREIHITLEIYFEEHSRIFGNTFNYEPSQFSDWALRLLNSFSMWSW